MVENENGETAVGETELIVNDPYAEFGEGDADLAATLAEIAQAEAALAGTEAHDIGEVVVEGAIDQGASDIVIGADGDDEPQLGSLLGGYDSNEEEEEQTIIEPLQECVAEPIPTSAPQPAAPSQPRSDDAAPAFAPGVRVRVQGLVSAHHMNGHFGSLQEFNAELGRWNVLVDIGGGLTETIAVKPVNIVAEASGVTEAPIAAAAGTAVCTAAAMDVGEPAQSAEHSAPIDSAPEAAAADDQVAGTLEEGAFVKIEGLKGAAHLNGLVGCLVQFDAELQRWEVQLPGEDTVKAIKADNLVFVPYDEDTAMEFGEAEGADEEGEAVEEQPDKGDEEEVKDEEAPDGFEAGAFVIIHGLKSAAHLNGQIGELQAFDPTNGRWQVKVLEDESGQWMAIKPDNLILEEVDDEEEGEDELVQEYSALDANQVHALLIEAELTADQDNVDKLKYVLENRNDDLNMEDFMELQTGVVGAIIGKEGSKIKELIAETGVFMSFQPDDEARPDIRVLRLSGKKISNRSGQAYCGFGNSKDIESADVE